MSKKSKITNTSNKAPGPVIEGIPVGLTVGAGAILAQEAQGTAEVAAANGMLLPVQGTTDLSDQLDCQRIGIKLGDYTDDPLFRKATLPAGWKTVPSSEDSRTTNIIDGKGNVRGSIWYKAAFYDRSARMYLNRRYVIRQHYPPAGPAENSRCWVIHDQATGKDIWAGVPFAYPTYGADRAAWEEFDKIEQARGREAIAWLRECAPDFENVAAYWDDAP